MHSDAHSIIEALSAAGVAAGLVDESDRVLELNDAAQSLLAGAGALSEPTPLADLLERCGAVRVGALEEDVYRLPREGGGESSYLRVGRVGAGEAALVRFDDVSAEWREISRLSTAVDTSEALMRQADIGVWMFDPDTEIVEVDEVLSARQGVTKRTTTLERALATIHPDDRQLERNAREYVLRTGGTATTRLRTRKLDGGWSVMRVHSVAGEKTPGGSYRVHCMSEDVTTLVAMQDESVSNARRLETALVGAKAGVFEFDLESWETWESSYLVELIGEEAMERSREDPFQKYHPDDVERVRTHAENSIREARQGIEGLEARLYRPDGEEFWVRITTRLMFDDDGKPVRVIGHLQDINESKHQELALIQAKQEAEAAAVAKTNFLASMSHEIRTPLNGVLGMAQILSLGRLDDDQREHVNTIIDCGQSLMGLLNDVLDISKIAAGKLEINPVEGDLVDAVRRAQQLFKAMATAKGIDLDLVIKGDPPNRMMFDPLRVRQCLSNLLANALKFTERGSVRLEVGGAMLEDGAYEASIKVIDSGIGIEPGNVARLFEPFTQADESTTRRFGGSGLGLSITRDLARSMGGDVTATSEIGRGSEFDLRFRCDLPAGAAIGLDAQGDTDQDEGVSGKPRPRVLLVDDNLVNRKVARIFLRVFGAEVVEVDDGAEALAKIESEPFDLVLLDVHMPVMDGREVIARIRTSDADWRDIKVIAMTAHAMQGDSDKFVAMGMDDYISKPIDQRDFNEKIMRALSLDDEDEVAKSVA